MNSVAPASASRRSCCSTSRSSDQHEVRWAAYTFPVEQCPIAWHEVGFPEVLGDPGTGVAGSVGDRDGKVDHDPWCRLPGSLGRCADQPGDMAFESDRGGVM